MLAPAANHEPASTPGVECAASDHRAPCGSRTFCLEPQHTAAGAQIPGKDGGCKKISSGNCCFCPAPKAEHSSSYPAAQGGRIGQTRWIFAVWCCLLGRVAACQAFTGLLTTTQAVVPRRRQPVRQHRECLPTLPANSASNPNPFVTVIVRLPKTLAMTDDRRGLTYWAPSRQTIQRNYPGSMLSSVSGNAITRIRLA